MVTQCMDPVHDVPCSNTIDDHRWFGSDGDVLTVIQTYTHTYLKSQLFHENVFGSIQTLRKCNTGQH